MSFLTSSSGAESVPRAAVHGGRPSAHPDAGRRLAAPPVGAHLTGCLLCGALNRLPASREAMQCWQCDSPLPDRGPRSWDEARQHLAIASALLWTAWISLAVSHLWPMVALEIGGHRNAVTLFGAALALWNEDRLALSAAVSLTTIVAPLAEAAAMLATVMGLSARAHGRAGSSRWVVQAVHIWQAMKGWNMTEVLVLGTGVALVKLGQLATLIVGPAFIGLMVFMVLRLAAMRFLSPAQAWALVDADPVRT